MQSEADAKRRLREGVYLSAAEEVTSAYQLLTNLATIDITKSNPADKLTGFFTAVNKASLVASDSTAHAIGEFLVGYSGAFFHLLARIQDIQDARTARDINEQAYHRYQNEVSRILASMTQFNEEAKAIPEVGNALERSLEFNMQRAQKAAESRSLAWNQLNEHTLIFLRGALPVIKEVSDLTVPALVAIRAELGISTDIDAYRSDLERRFTSVQQQMEGFLVEVSRRSV